MTRLNAPTSQTPQTNASPWVILRGCVEGVEACQLLTDRKSIVVGSALDCDLVVADPLIPARAFEIQFRREHAVGTSLQGGWLLEALPGARVFINNDHARSERLAFGDVISLGCHRIAFEAGDAAARPQRTATQVDDLCARLLDRMPVPANYLNGLPMWRDRIRGRKAALAGLLLAALVLLSLLVRGDPPAFVSSAHEGPVEVSLAPTQSLAGAGSKSLSSVARKSFNSAEAPPPLPAELQPLEQAPPEAMAAETIKTAEVAAPPPPPPALAPVGVDAGPQLGALSVGLPVDARLEIKASAQALTGGAAVRRVALANAEAAVAPAELGAGTAGGVRTDNVAAPPAAMSTKYANQLTQQKGVAPAPGQLVSNGPSQAMAELAAYRPSPVKYEQYNGNRIPVARMPENLGALAVATPAPGTPAASGADGAAGSGAGGKAGAGKGFVLDGQINEDEVSLSWKSGRFRLHGPGTPPEANPATFCYVGQTEQEGRKYLYISFLCVDPNVDQIRSHWTQNDSSGGQNSAHEICLDDSVEIFLDTKFNRFDYNQIIVNARGTWWTAYYVKPDGPMDQNVRPWQVDLKVKTTINKQAGNWVCEILVPFDKLGGVPPKGSRWAVNFCRNFRGQINDDQLQTWFLVYDKTRNFHHPALFGVFQW